jgi:hypothetical protein
VALLEAEVDEETAGGARCARDRSHRTHVLCIAIADLRRILGAERVELGTQLPAPFYREGHLFPRASRGRKRPCALSRLRFCTIRH